MVSLRSGAFVILYAVFAILPWFGFADVEWVDWDRRQICMPERYIQPGTEAELIDVIKNAANNGMQVKVVGSGHSFSSITLTDVDRGAILLNLDKLNQVLEIDGKQFEVTVQAGIRIHVLNDILLKSGFALINTGAIAQQSIAGATQTGTHGTGKQIGSMSTAIQSFKILLANGTVLNGVSADTNPELFYAGRVGLGCLGVMMEMTLAIYPKFKLKRTAMPYSLKQLLIDLPQLEQQYDRMQWYYTPYTDNATLLLREAVPIDTPIVPCWPGALSTSLTNNVTCIDWSFKALCHEADDNIKYTEMEYFVDAKDGLSLAVAFLAAQSSLANSTYNDCKTQKFGACTLFTGMRYAAADENWMSPMYNQDIAVVSNIVLGTPDIAGPPEIFSAYGRELEKIATLEYGGRPHWGKMNWATSHDLRPAYPMLDNFVKLREALDPNRMFLNAYVQQRLGV
jgi:L-gulonolactone oxidase